MRRLKYISWVCLAPLSIISMVAIPSKTLSGQQRLLAGSDKYKSKLYLDSAILLYKRYTIIVKKHNDSPGEDITVITKASKKCSIIDIPEAYSAQYFSGLKQNKVVIDAGTGNLRRNFIYDLKKDRLVDSIYHVLGAIKICNQRLYYLAMMSDSRIKKMNLPVCSNPGMELSGYVEYAYYNFITRKTRPTGKYECLN